MALKLRRKLAGLALVAAAEISMVNPAFAIQPFTVKDIRVEGVQRIEPGTVFSYLPIQIGDSMTDEKAQQAIRSLYGTGFFSDVRVEVENDVLVIIVDERPAIGAIDITGAKEFEKENLLKALKEAGLAEARIYDRALLERAEQELKRQYLARGKYDVQVVSTVTPLERNRVGVSIAIDEGENTSIREIRILGAQAFSESDLIEMMKSTTPGWFTWYTKSDQYSRQKLQGDLETLRSYYLDRGYLEFSIDSHQVTLSPDRKDIFITIVINEGKQYTVSSVDIAGETLGRDEELKALVDVKPGEVFNNRKLTDSAKRMTDRFGELGYAFANANPVPKIDREARKVAFTIYVDPGRRAYVRRINIAGNNKTRDEVIRRELRQYEGAWYDSEKLRLSRERIERLSYFDEVSIENASVPGSPDQLDVNVKVNERATGNIMLGVGFSSTDRLILTGAINQPNFFGSGNFVGLEVNTSKYQRTFSLTHTNPYFTDDGVSRSYDLYSRTINPSYLSLGNYRYRTNGLGLRFGLPYTEYDRFSFGTAFENTQLFLTRDGTNPSPQRFLTYEDQFGSSSSAWLLTAGWSQDKRDSVLVPNKGRYQYASFDVTMPVLDVRYYRLTYGHQYYMPVWKGFTLAFNGELGYGAGFGGKPYPLFKNFYAGGIGSVRGFAPSTLGTRCEPAECPMSYDQVALGGTKRAVGSMEFYFPIPGTGIDRTFRLFTFLDGGYVWGEDEKVRASDLRYSAGLGLSWVSPFGPLKFSFGFPLNKKEGDQTQRFQFQIGTGF